MQPSLCSLQRIYLLLRLSRCMRHCADIEPTQVSGPQVMEHGRSATALDLGVKRFPVSPMARSSESVGDIEDKPAPVADAGRHTPVVVGCHDDAQLVFDHNRVSKLRFKLKPWFGNQS